MYVSLLMYQGVENSDAQTPIAVIDLQYKMHMIGGRSHDKN